MQATYFTTFFLLYQWLLRLASLVSSLMRRGLIILLTHGHRRRTSSQKKNDRGMAVDERHPVAGSSYAWVSGGFPKLMENTPSKR